jgi:hypothetical protein
VDNNIRSQGAWRLLAQPFEKRVFRHRLDMGTYLIVTVLLSLGVWAGIWGATSLAAVVLP